MLPADIYSPRTGPSAVIALPATREPFASRKRTASQPPSASEQCGHLPEFHTRRRTAHPVLALIGSRTPAKLGKPLITKLHAITVRQTK